MDTVRPDHPEMPARRRVLSAMAGAFLWPAAGACEVPALRDTRYLFGSPIEVMLRPPPGGQAAGARAMTEVMAGLERLNREWNAWKPGELGRLNQALREGRGHRVTPDLLALIRLARTLEVRSSGLFNAGIGGIVGAWGFHDDVMRPGSRPDPQRLERWLRSNPSLSQLLIDGDQVLGRNRWLQLDFGAIAKGWALDRALDHLGQRGQPHAVVNLGGNLATRGRAGQRPWQIGIRDPLDGGVMAHVATSGREAVVTSGSYERFRVIDGERLSHIIDPRSAAPAPGLLSVTVLHTSAALADAAATALLVAGPRHWPFVADRLRVRQVLVVGPDGQGALTAELAARLQFSDPGWASRLRVVA
jgi:FAD:protein FMN transferase